MDFIRNRLLRSIPDLSATAFLGLIIPVTYWFELGVVLPQIRFLHTPFRYYSHLILGSVLLFQVVGNWIFCICTNTSTKGLVLPLPKQSDVDLTKRDKWRFCAVCESLQPPRTWHCKTCNQCILKRDHHCLFTGCCVGHRNQRYFLLLVFYLWVATTYATFYNNYFVWILHGKEFRSWYTILKTIFPVFWAMMDFSASQLHFMVYVINLVGSLFTGALLFYHGKNALRGQLAYEANGKTKVCFSLGWRRNLEMIFGKRMLLAFLNPFARSELPHDGVHWEVPDKSQ